MKLFSARNKKFALYGALAYGAFWAFSRWRTGKRATATTFNEGGVGVVISGASLNPTSQPLMPAPTAEPIVTAQQLTTFMHRSI